MIPKSLNLKTIVIGSAILMVIFGCSESFDQDSQSKIVGGKNDEISFPAVAELGIEDKYANDNWRSFCTGTFVSSDLFLTAAHCITGIDSYIKAYNMPKKLFVRSPILENKISSEIVILAPDSDKLQDKNGRRVPEYRYTDLAFIKFAANTIPSNLIAKIATQEPTKGEDVTLIGYGHDTFDTEYYMHTGGGVRRVGKSKFNGYLDEEMKTTINVAGIVSTKSLEKHPDLGASTLPGDSGGPLFNAKGEIIGILSSGYDYDDINYSLYVNVNFQKSRDFIDCVLKSNEDKTSCSAPKGE